MLVTQIRPRLIPTGLRLPYLEARKAVEKKGGLPPHKLLDQCLVETNAWEPIRDKFPFLARELLVSPQEGMSFPKGQDIHDPVPDSHGRAWVLPASCIPAQAFDLPNVILFLAPSAIDETSTQVFIHANPSSVIVHPVVPEGLADAVTALPLPVHSDVLLRVPDAQKRILFKAKRMAITPLVRFASGVFGRRDIYVDDRHDVAFGAAYVAYHLLRADGIHAATLSLPELKVLAQGSRLNDLRDHLPQQIAQSAVSVARRYIRENSL